jgi:hypothetical protein
MNSKDKEYGLIHKWLRKTYGSANTCEFCRTKESKHYDWALKRGFAHKKDISHYLQLCRKCHINYDYTDERRKNQSIANKRKYSNIENRISQRKSAPKKEVCQYSPENVFIKTYPSVREAARQTGINPSCISRVCNGERENAGGYIWEYEFIT